MQKYGSERKVTADVYPYKKSYSEKNYAGRPEKDHKARFSPYIIKDKCQKIFVGYFKYLPVFTLILKIFNLQCHKRKLCSNLAFWRSIAKDLLWKNITTRRIRFEIRLSSLNVIPFF